MIEFILEFVRRNSGLLALATSMISVFIAVSVRHINAENRFFDKLESDSLNQIEKNHKDMERILSNKIEVEPGKYISLLDLLDGVEKHYNFQKFEHMLQSLAKYFSEYCANLDKYNSNIMHRKKICMVFQEHGRRARRILNFFEKAEYSDIGIEFAKTHLLQAEIIGHEENS